MTLIALSGGIAAGKSTVGRRLAELGAVRLDADQLAREVVEPGTPGLARIAERFGSGVIASDGSLDRARLAARVFGDPEALRELNGIVHPAVRDRFARRLAAARIADPDAVIVYEIPLLVESGSPVGADLVVIAEAPEALRAARLVELRGMAPEEAKRRIASQASDAQRRAVADRVIDTSGTLADTLAQVDALWDGLRRRRTEGRAGPDAQTNGAAPSRAGELREPVESELRDRGDDDDAERDDHPAPRIEGAEHSTSRGAEGHVPHRVGAQE